MDDEEWDWIVIQCDSSLVNFPSKCLLVKNTRIVECLALGNM